MRNDQILRGVCLVYVFKCKQDKWRKSFSLIKIRVFYRNSFQGCCITFNRTVAFIPQERIINQYESYFLFKIVSLNIKHTYMMTM